MRALNRGFVGSCRSAMRHRDHGDMRLEQLIHLGVDGAAGFFITQGGRFSQLRCDVIKLLAKLVGCASAKVEVIEVGRVRVVASPTEQVDTFQLSSVGCIDECSRTPSR